MTASARDEPVPPWWHDGIGERDWRVVATWNPEWQLADVLADYDTCDLFARFLIETGAGDGTYHAALFGYCFLNGMRYVQRRAMFDAACRNLAPDFERFAAEMRAASTAAAARQPVALAMRCGTVHWHDEFEHADQFHDELVGVGYGSRLAPDFGRAFREPGAELVIGRNTIGSALLRSEPPAFRLTAVLDGQAVAEHNGTALRRLRADRDTCCYLQLDTLVVLHEPDAWHDDAVLALLRLCCQRRYGQSHPGIIERVGRPGRHRDYFVVHCPAGPEPDAVREVLTARHHRMDVVVRPF